MSRISNKSIKIDMSLPVTITKEGKYFVAYTPALDLATSAGTFDEVKRRFEEIVEIFFEELVQRGTLEKVLELYGWRKVRKQWEPPMIVAQEEQKVNVTIGAY